jgi:hypothetical protein
VYASAIRSSLVKHPDVFKILTLTSLDKVQKRSITYLTHPRGKVKHKKTDLTSFFKHLRKEVVNHSKVIHHLDVTHAYQFWEQLANIFPIQSYKVMNLPF